MQRNTGLRDPFAMDDDEPPRSGPARPPPRASRFAPSMATPGGATASSSRLPGSLGTPRTLGLSLGVPRGRVHAHVDAGAPLEAEAMPGKGRQTDEAVRATDSDALLSRLSALRLGYLPAEPYTQELASPGPNGAHGRNDPGARRSPLINIGTYLRCTAIDNHVESFLTSHPGPKQIISIGAGSDSRYWRIMSDARLAEQLAQYVELDFGENTRQKLACIRRSAVLRAQLDATGPAETEPSADDDEVCMLKSSKYQLLAADVRRLRPDTPSDERLDPDRVFGMLDASLPTLVLFECVLAYIEPKQADWLLRHLGERFARISAVSYDIALANEASDPSSPPSRFGRVMLSNLERRRLSLPGAKAYPTIGAQSQRLVDAWSNSPDGRDRMEGDEPHVQVAATSLYAVWTDLPGEQKQRLSRLEGLDEVEEFDMLLQHYCIVRAERG